MKCANCDNEFEPKHFNQKMCSDDCRRAAVRQTKARFKKTHKGAECENRWRKSPSKKATDKRYRQTPKAKRLAVIRAQRTLKNNPHLQERKRERDREFARTEYGRSLNVRAKKKYVQTDKGIAARKNGKARRRQRERTGIVTASEWATKLAEYGGRCAFCGSCERIEQDHIVPLARGGKHEIENLRPLCRKCNGKKNSKLDSELSASIAPTRLSTTNPT